jgi:hypothetical protein
MGVNTAAKRADAWMNECFSAGLLRLFLNLDEDSSRPRNDIRRSASDADSDEHQPPAR